MDSLRVFSEEIFEENMNAETEERQTRSRQRQPSSAGMNLACSRRRKASGQWCWNVE